MNITQHPKFQPITIQLTTKEEAEAMWEIVRGVMSTTGVVGPRSKTMAGEISDWFSTEAQL